MWAEYRKLSRMVWFPIDYKSRSYYHLLAQRKMGREQFVEPGDQDQSCGSWHSASLLEVGQSSWKNISLKGKKKETQKACWSWHKHMTDSLRSLPEITRGVKRKRDHACVWRWSHSLWNVLLLIWPMLRLGNLGSWGPILLKSSSNEQWRLT